MRAGPLRRAAGTLGLVALVPTALMLLGGGITLQVAAIRAGITLVIAIGLARLGTWAVGQIADGAAGRAQAGAPSPANPSATTAPASGHKPAAAALTRPAPDAADAPGRAPLPMKVGGR